MPTPGSDSASGTAQGSPEPPKALVTALQRLLVPLVRLLLSHGVTHPFLGNLLKRVYVDVAESEFALERRRQTISRLSLLTGIHRKDVKRLREERAEVTAVPRSVSLGAQLVSRWMGLAEFRDGADPRRLPRLAPADGSPSFESLVESVSKDIRPRAILDEWIRLGVVHLDDEDRVCLNERAFVPEKGFDEKAHYLGRSLRDHLSAAGRNLLGREAPLLERTVYYDDLSVASVDELSELSRTLGAEALEAVNRRAIELQGRDASGGDTSRRMSFGVYFYEEADEGAEPPGDPDA
ncbi:MAG: DUF6502 family protein [Myxococcota bacterium]|nr:DUF6502 family protein [Myxococcota bacterium]